MMPKPPPKHLLFKVIDIIIVVTFNPVKIKLLVVLETKTTPMNWIMEFLNCEKSLYLFAGIIGIVSLIVGLLFLLFSIHKSFAITMIIMGVLEIGVMFPTYFKYPQKITSKISIYENNPTEFLKTETVTTEKALKSFFWLKLTYAILIVVLCLGMSFISPKSVIFGICTALILHFAFAITIDNFGEKYTQKYLTELAELE